jgi:hypothetical protein
MALWGNNDSKTASGYANISSNGFVNGTSSVLQSEAKIGDFITMANNDYLIISITSNTAAQVIGRYGNTSVTAAANAAYILSEKPKYALWDATSDGGSNNVYGVDTTEAGVTNGAVREVVFTSRGSGYTANATLTVSGGAGSTTAATGNAQSNSSGRISAINFTNNGIGYTIPPTLTVADPGKIFFNGNVTGGSVVLGNATSDSTTFKLDNGYLALGATNTAFLANGDQVTYLALAGNTAIGGLTNAASYYVYTINSTALALYTRAGGVNSYINIASVGTGAQANHSLTGETATVAAVLSGFHGSAHAGWVLRTAGTGGRAGRVQTETLIAMGSMTGDGSASANDDTTYADA